MKYTCESCGDLFEEIKDDFGFLLCPECAPDHYCVRCLSPSFNENEGDLCQNCLRQLEKAFGSEGKRILPTSLYFPHDIERIPVSPDLLIGTPDDTYGESSGEKIRIPKDSIRIKK